MADLRPADDLSILAGEVLQIRIFPCEDALQSVPGEALSRPSSGSIKGRDMKEPLSMDLGSLATIDDTRTRGTNGCFHVATVTAAQVRSLGLRIIRNPIVDEDPPNPAHVLILGTRESLGTKHLEGGLTKGEYKDLARLMRVPFVWTPPAG